MQSDAALERGAGKTWTRMSLWTPLRFYELSEGVGKGSKLRSFSTRVKRRNEMLLMEALRLGKAEDEEGRR